MENVRYRQIHLDFHTSEYIEGIGSKFNANEFVKTLKDANVNSINLFYKGHHGNYYYDTKIGRKHPHLDFDLFGEQLRACKDEGINTYAYTCVGWNEDWAIRHPECLSIKKDGILGTISPFETRNYKWFRICCGNNNMIQYMKDEIIEVVQIYGTDMFAGFWIDIVTAPMCVCQAVLQT